MASVNRAQSLPVIYEEETVEPFADDEEDVHPFDDSSTETVVDILQMKGRAQIVESDIKSKKLFKPLKFPFARSNRPILLPLCTSAFEQMCIEELSVHCSLLILTLRQYFAKMTDGCFGPTVSKKIVKLIDVVTEMIGRYRQLILATKENILHMDVPTAAGKAKFSHFYAEDRIPPHLKSHCTQINVASDGSCFYRAVSVALTGTEEYVEELKLIMLEWMASNREQIEKTLKDVFQLSFEELFYKTLQYSEWAEDFHVAVMAVALGKPIHVYRFLKKSHQLCKYGEEAPDFPHYPVITGEKGHPIVLQYVSAGYYGTTYQPNHYVPLLIEN